MQVYFKAVETLSSLLIFKTREIESLSLVHMTKLVNSEQVGVSLCAREPLKYLNEEDFSLMFRYLQ